MFFTQFLRRQNSDTASKSSTTLYEVVPLPLLVVYPLLVIADIGLTYIGTPDLKYESNLLIVKLSLGWTAIILLAGISVLTVIWLTTVVNNSYRNRTPSGFSRKQNFVHFMIISAFYIHFFISIFAICNNFLGVVNLYHKNESPVTSLSVWYVNLYNKYIGVFLFFSYLIFGISGIIVSTKRLRLFCTNNK